MGSLTFARLRPRGERTWLALACSGAVVPWVIPFTPFADAVIVTSCALLCALTPLAWALGDRAHAQVVAWILDDGPTS